MRCIVLFWGIFIFMLCGCAANPPAHPENICRIFQENPKWYAHANSARKKWQIPISLMMAIMYQESGYRADAKPPRTRCLWIFPGPRPSSAYGYAQAIDGTWALYCRINPGADRDSFDDAVDFIGWYCRQSVFKCRISPHDAYTHYLAYHEGWQGFLQKSYKRKKWLKNTAQKVKNRANTYAHQLSECERKFQKAKGKCCLWPF